MQIPIYKINNQEIYIYFNDDPSTANRYELEIEINKQECSEYDSVAIWNFKNFSLCLACINWLMSKLEVIEENN